MSSAGRVRRRRERYGKNRQEHRKYESYQQNDMEVDRVDGQGGYELRSKCGQRFGLLRRSQVHVATGSAGKKASSSTTSHR